MQSPIARFHVLTDDRLAASGGSSHAEQARLAAAGGAGAVQFRAKSGTDRERLDALRAVADALRGTGVQLWVDDRLDLALAAGADGVHLGQTDLPVADARRLADAVRPGLWIGATATTAGQARRAEADGADLVGFGPVFPTASKDNPPSVKGLDGLAEACAAVRIPVLAIAGITPDRIAGCLDAGAWGVAVMSAVTRAEDSAGAARELAGAVAGVSGLDQT